LGLGKTLNGVQVGSETTMGFAYYSPDGSLEIGTCGYREW